MADNEPLREHAENGDSGNGAPQDDQAEIIRLDDFLKRSGLVGTGGEAKLRIQSGEVLVNGEIETRRRKQLTRGDVVELFGQRLVVQSLCDDAT